MIVVVADTSPIYYLIRVEAIGALGRLFDQVVIPKTVLDELLKSSTPEVLSWISNLPPWITIQQAHRVTPMDLDPGETEAIALAKELRAFAVILDDRQAREAARAEGLRVTGTLGILERAATNGIIDLVTTFQKLRTTSFRVTPELLQSILNRHAQSGSNGG